MTWGNSAPYGKETPWGGIGGAIIQAFNVVSAEALSLTSIRVNFSVNLQNSPQTIDPANYSIPGLEISSVALETDTSVRIVISDNMLFEAYTVTVSNIKSIFAQDLVVRSATFTGFASPPKFFATAQSSVKVQVVFNQEMLDGPAISDPTNFGIADLNGNGIEVISATPNGISGVTAVSLVLASDLQSSLPYTVTLDPSVVSVDDLSLNPNVVRFAWVDQPTQANISIGDFSGELQGGLFGTPAGQVFFSPSFATTGVTNSILQIESVSVCTKAFDTYTFPVPVDPPVFFTWGGPQPGLLANGGFVLWADPYTLSEATMALGDKRQDTIGTATDGRCVAVLQEPFDLTKVSLLSDTYWNLFDGATLDAHTFRTADNSAPIGPGGTTTVTLA